MKFTYKVITVIALCVVMGQLTSASAPVKAKPMKIKLVKTDPETHDVRWQYGFPDRVGQAYKYIKKYVNISAAPGETIQIIDSSDTPRNPFPNTTFEIPKSLAKNEVLAIDGNGRVEVKDQGEVKKALNAFKEIRIKMIKTESRGKPWKYSFRKFPSWKFSAEKTMKNDAIVPVIPGHSGIKVKIDDKKFIYDVPANITKSSVLAIDAGGNISVKSEAEVKQMIALPKIP